MTSKGAKQEREMIDVFVSRPTWVADNFRAGLEHFLGFLGSVGLKPRTIGATDYPSKAPLDEVIRLMDCCAGAVILGYPQIVATAGSLKDQSLQAPLTLPTEWNHIEAGLAYARGLPLLVIHHRGVCRGIFDRGAISSFVYELDLEEPAWPLSDQVRGAVENWKGHVLERGATPNEGTSPVSSAPTMSPLALTDDHFNVLKLLADSDEPLEADDIAQDLEVPLQKARFYLDDLVEAKYVGRSVAITRPTLYFLAKAGRAALVQQGLL
jgi:hypothetical protein